MDNYYLYESNKLNKKYMVKFINEDTGRLNTLHFGDNRYDSYETHNDKYRKLAYERRHSKEDWNDLKTSGAWSKGLLWNKKSLDESIKDMEKQFNIKIYKQF